VSDTDILDRLSNRKTWLELEGLDPSAADVQSAIEEIDRLRAEIAALKPQSNADEFASIPLSSWVIEVFHHLCDSPHTPDSWKRDLNKKTQVLLNAIEQGKEAKP
jgi:hypothetical protein